MKKKRILVDLDGIMTNLLGQWLDTYNQENDDDVRPEDITTWDMHEHVKIGKGIYKIPARPGYFDKTPPLPGAVGGFLALKKAGHDVLVCSSPYNADSARAKHDWCMRFLNTRTSEVTLTHKKSWIDCDVIIDDKPSTIVEFAKLGREVITIAYPYNESVAHHCALRADCYKNTNYAWEEIVNHLNG
jgi:5'(3')-deoxyribonucleotidase